jgi:cellulose synthase/poly-beta-1,6-N-acetylglucosamine synthase-like glycosyltransferase
VGRLGWNNFGDNLIISGAFGLFLRASVIAIGGYEKSTVGEDMEIVARLKRHGYESHTPSRVAFLPDPVAWTQAPEILSVLAAQRDRWHRGLAEVLWRHRRLFFNPRYGALGMVVYPSFFFIELLAPVVETLGLMDLGLAYAAAAVDLHFALLLFLAAYGYGLVLSVFTLLFEELSYRRYHRLRDRMWLVAWALIENLGYRQLTALWRIRGLIRLLLGEHDWGKMERKSFQEQRAS